VNIPVVYEDDWLMVIDKPAGLLTIPTPKMEKRTLISILNDDLRTKGASFLMHPCHRLDRDTSGLIIFAKGKSIQKKIMELFKGRKIKKKYLAFVSGNLSKEEGEIKNSIEGLAAKTNYRVIEKRKGFSIVEIEPATGRTNQIRIHFKQIGHPILGESKYAFRKDFEIKAKRLCLHAAEVEFTHPINKKQVHLYSDLPKDMQEFLKQHN